MLPELLNKAFSANPHNVYVENSTESLMTPKFRRKNEVCSSVVIDRHTHTYTKTTTITLAHVPRVNKHEKHNVKI